MEEIGKYREMLRLIKVRQRAAERALAEVIGHKRDLLKRIERHLADAHDVAMSTGNPSPGDLKFAARAGEAMRAKADACRTTIDELAPEIEKREAELSEVMRKVTAVKGIIRRLEAEEAIRAEEREDEATLAVTQMQRADD